MSRPAGARTTTLAALVVVVLALPASAVSRDHGVFTDDDGIPAEQALEWLAAAGVVDGCNPPSDNLICPDRVLTRAEAAKVLVLIGRHQGLMAATRPGGVDHFADDDLTWQGAAEPLIGHLADLSIVHGCDPPANRHFCPEASLLRGQVAKMTVRALGLVAPGDFASPWEDTSGQFYAEAARVAAYHRLWDSSAGRFGGKDEVTRAEFARVVVKAVEPDLCAARPFTAERAEALRTRHPGISVAAYAFDLDEGCAYWLNPRARLQTASVFKVMVMAGTLLEAQGDGRDPTPWEMSQLEPMVTESANAPVRNLWRSFGAAPWFTEQAATFGLYETTVVGENGEPWGRTRTSGKDQADLLRQVILGEWGPLDAPGRAVAYDLMTSVVAAQTWGATAGVPADRVVAQKNGFAGGTANTAGVVYDAEGRADYVVVVLTNGWPYWQAGVATVEEVAGWAAAELSNQ